MDEVIIKYRWTIDELIAALRWHYRHTTRPFFRRALLGMAIFIFVAGIGVLVGGDLKAGAFCAGLGLLMILGLTAVTPWQARRQFRHSPHKDAEIEWRISAEQLKTISPHSRTEADWTAPSKIVKTPEGLLVYFGPQSFHWIPRHGFANDADFASVAQLAEKQARQFLNIDETAKRRFQFSVKNLLWATFWVCIWAAAFSFLKTFLSAHRPIGNLPWLTSASAVWFPAFLIICTPVIAIGAFFGRTRRGALIGVILAAICLASALAVVM